MASQAAALPRLGTILLAQVRYQAVLVLRTPRAFVLALVVPAIMLALETQVRHSFTHVSSATVASQVAGLSVFGTLSVAYFTYAAGLIAAREEGVLRRWHAAPLPSSAYFTGRIIAFVLLADASGLIVLLVGVTLANLHLTAGELVGMLAAETLGSLAVAAAATAITPLITSVDAATPVLTLTYFPLLLFSGSFSALPGLPHWLNTAMTYLPVQPVVHAITQTLKHSGGSGLMSLHDLVVLATWAVGGLLISARYFRWSPSRPAHARRTHTEMASSGTQEALR